MNAPLKLILFLLLSIPLLSGTIDLDNLFNYANQEIPVYITKDNTVDNPITDEGATLGRVLFYDKKLSSDNSIACANCHLQEFAFSDTEQVSVGVNGTTPRHSMRLINSRFSVEKKFFWDERAETLEEQTTMPIQDHAEMGYSGENSDPSFSDLIDKLDALPYYDVLFSFAFGDPEITEERIQKALAQFVRSIQSFDSKYDIGRAQVDSNTEDFPNFTADENQGKSLFMSLPQFNDESQRISGGLGCHSCHLAPEFDIDPGTFSNGVIFAVDGSFDFGITRAPTLRDLFNPDDALNGNFMHNANLGSLNQVLSHYNSINAFENLPPAQGQIDLRLLPNEIPQNLNITVQERQQVIAFMKTLSGTDVYSNEKWSNPFSQDGSVELIGSPTAVNEELESLIFQVYPNPTASQLYVNSELSSYTLELYDSKGNKIFFKEIANANPFLNLEKLHSGIYYLLIKTDSFSQVKKIIRL